MKISHQEEATIIDFCNKNGLHYYGKIGGKITLIRNPNNRRIAATDTEMPFWICQRKVREIASVIEFSGFGEAAEFLIEDILPRRQKENANGSY